MDHQRYDPITQSLHWLTAVAVAATYAIGLLREEMPRGLARTQLLDTHVSIGLLVLGLTLARLAWRLMAPRLDPVPGPRLLALAARLGHLALYAAMLAVPMVGIAIVWAKGQEPGLFGLFTLPAPFTANRSLARFLEETHEVAAHLFMILAGLHALAAVVHQVFLRDGTLARMVPVFRHNAETRR